MASVIKNIANNPNISYREIYCDTVDDMRQVNVTGLPMASTCYIIDTGEQFILNSKGEWKPYRGATSSEGDGGGSSGGDFSEVIIYDGGSSSGN